MSNCLSAIASVQRRGGRCTNGIWRLGRGCLQLAVTRSADTREEVSPSLPRSRRPPRTATHRTDGAVWMWRAPWRPRQPSSRSERRPLIAAGTPDCCVAAEEDRGSRARGARRLRLRGVARGVALDVRACGLQGSSCLVPAGLHASDGVCQLVVTGKNLWSSFDPGV